MRNEPASGIGLMGILNQIWWLLGLLMAAPLLIAGLQFILAGNYLFGVPVLALGGAVLLLPEYIRWRLLGGSSPFERVPLIGTPTDQSER